MDLLTTLHELRLTIWQIRQELFQQAFLGFSWWFIAITIAVSYAVWWKLVDKRRIIELLLFGSFIAVTRVIFDNWGISSGRWTYVIDLVPVGYSLFLNDLTVIPLSLMLVYQFTSTWTSFILWLAIVQGVTSFVFWPTAISLGILKLHNWQLYYSYLAVLFTAVTMRAIMIFGLKVERKAREDLSQTSSTLLVAEPAMKPLENKEDDN